MVATQKLSNLQQELLKLYAQNVSETDLQNIRELLGHYFAQRLTDIADKAWDEHGWSEQTMHRWLNEEDQ